LKVIAMPSSKRHNATAQVCVLVFIILQSVIFGAADTLSVGKTPEKLEIPRFFSSDMVLQREMPLKFWGWGTSGDKIQVRFFRQGKEFSSSVQIDGQGKWKTELPAQPVCSTPCTVIIKDVSSGSDSIVLTNVLVGDVWLITGQSNMEKKLKDIFGADTLIPQSKNYPLIRSFLAKSAPIPEPSDRLRRDSEPWFICNEANKVGNKVSGIAYVFAVKLSQTLNIPIGILQSYRGGTEIETWLSQEKINSDPALAMVRDRAEKWNPLDSNARRRFHSFNYNGNIHPLAGLPIKGNIWYQGESNTKRSLEYATLFKALIEEWRQEWGQGDFPFLYVQLFNMGITNDTIYEEDDWADLREQQAKVLESGLPNVGMVVTIDTNEDPDNPESLIRIHPKNKVVLGERMAALALQKVYGKPVLGESPMYKSCKVIGSKVDIVLKNCGKGLKLKPGDSELKGFAVAGEDKIFHKNVTAIIRNDSTVTVTCPDVAKPVAVRYAWAKNPKCNLYNSDLFPAAPFRTDNWKSRFVYPDQKKKKTD
jgi:sialate O-acetylesterase